MFIEFIDQLRCTSDHEESWLVASFAERSDRFIIRGTLGCYICSRQFAIEDGVARFGDLAKLEALRGGGATTVNPTASDPEAVMRLAAFLGAAERSTFVVAGEWAEHAHSLTQLFPMRIFALNALSAIGDSEYVGVIASSEGIPLSALSVHGVALDSVNATAENLRSALRVLRPSGRLIAPVSVEVPHGVSVLAQDDEVWVGEKIAELVTLRR